MPKHSPDKGISHKQAEVTKRILMQVGAGLALVFLVMTIYLVSDETPQSAELETTAEPQVIVSDEEIEQQRERFKQALAAFEAEIQPLLDDPELASWKPQAMTEARDKKQNSIAEFATAKYQSALGLLDQSKQQVLDAAKQWHDDFDEALGSATQALHNEQPNQAQLALNKAKQIKPSAEQVAALQQQLDVYPIVAKLQKEYKVAVTENNLDKQIAVLQEILNLDGTQEDARSLLNKALFRLKNDQFQQHIKTGLAQLEQGDFASADASYNLANTLFPNRAELQVLAKKLDKQEQELSLATVHNQLSALQLEDNWSAILDMTHQAEPYFPSDALILRYQQQATSILGLRDEVSDYVARPHRLADDNIQNNAKQLIRKAIPYLSQSPSLANDIKVISEHIDQHNAKYPLVITSDGKTHIEVHGTGVVGKTKNKTIQLTVGTYTLEGSRKGYRNKQVTIRVEASQNNSIKLVCNERI